MVSMTSRLVNVARFQVALQGKFTQVALDGDEAESMRDRLTSLLASKNRPSRTAAATIIRNAWASPVRGKLRAGNVFRPCKLALSSKSSTSLDQSTARGLLTLIVRSGT